MKKIQVYWYVGNVVFTATCHMERNGFQKDLETISEVKRVASYEEARGICEELMQKMRGEK